MILQLEQQGKASEAEMTRTMLKKTQGEVDQLRLKLQVSDSNHVSHEEFMQIYPPCVVTCRCVEGMEEVEGYILIC